MPATQSVFSVLAMGIAASTPAISSLSDRLVSPSATDRLSAAVALRALLNDRVQRAPTAVATSAKRVFGSAVLVHFKTLIRRLVRAAAWTLNEPRAVDAALAALDALASLAALFHAAQDHGVPHDALYDLAAALRKRAIPLLVIKVLHQDLRVSAAAAGALVPMCDLLVVKSAAWIPTARAALAFRNHQPSEHNLKTLLTSLSTLIHCIIYQAVTTATRSPQISLPNNHPRGPSHPRQVIQHSSSPIPRQPTQIDSFPTSPLSSPSPSHSRSNSLSHSSSSPQSAAPSPLTRARPLATDVSSTARPATAVRDSVQHHHLPDEYHIQSELSDNDPAETHLPHISDPAHSAFTSHESPVSRHGDRDRPEARPDVPWHRRTRILAIHRPLSVADAQTPGELDTNNGIDVGHPTSADRASPSSPISLDTTSSGSPDAHHSNFDHTHVTKNNSLQLRDIEFSSDNPRHPRAEDQRDDIRIVDISPANVDEPASSPLAGKGDRRNSKPPLSFDTAPRNSYPAVRNDDHTGERCEEYGPRNKSTLSHHLSRRRHGQQRHRPNATSQRNRLFRNASAWTRDYPEARPYLWRDMRAAMSCLATLLTYTTSPPVAKSLVASELIAVLVSAKSGHRARAAGIDHVAYRDTAMVAFLDHAPILYDVIMKTLFSESATDGAILTNAACDPRTAASCLSLLSALLDYAPDSCIPRPPLLLGLANRAHYIAHRVFSVVQLSEGDRSTSLLSAVVAQDCNERLTSVVSTLKCLKAACPPSCSDVQIEHAAGVALRSVCAAGALVSDRSVRADLPLASDSTVLEAMRSFKELSGVSPRGLLWARGPNYCAVVTMLAGFACRVSLVNILRARIDLETGTGADDVIGATKVAEIEVVPHQDIPRSQTNITTVNESTHIVTYEASASIPGSSTAAIASVRPESKNKPLPSSASASDGQMYAGAPVIVNSVSSPRLNRSNSRKRPHTIPRSPPVIPSAGTFYQGKELDATLSSSNGLNFGGEDGALSPHDTASVTCDSYTSNDEDDAASDSNVCGRNDPLDAFERDSSCFFEERPVGRTGLRNRGQRATEPRVISCGLEIQDDNPLEDSFRECLAVLIQQCGGHRVTHDLLRSIIRECACDARLAKSLTTKRETTSEKSASPSRAHVASVGHAKIPSDRFPVSGVATFIKADSTNKTADVTASLPRTDGAPVIADEASRQLRMITDASPATIGAWFQGRRPPLPHGQVSKSFGMVRSRLGDGSAMDRNMLESRHIAESIVKDDDSVAMNPDSGDTAVDSDAYEEMVGSLSVLLRALKEAVDGPEDATTSNDGTLSDEHYSTLLKLITADVEATKSPLLCGALRDALRTGKAAGGDQREQIEPLNSLRRSDRGETSKFSRTTVNRLFSEIASLRDEVATMRQMLETGSMASYVRSSPNFGSVSRCNGRRHSSSSAESNDVACRKPVARLLSRRRLSLFCGVSRTSRNCHES